MRQMLESAMVAARDAESCRMQLETLRVNSPVVARHRARLEVRMKRDEAIVDEATAALFGERGEALTPIQRDVLFHRYCLCEPWKAVANSIGYSVRQVEYIASDAMAVLG